MTEYAAGAYANAVHFPGSNWVGEVRMAYFAFELSAALVTGDTIRLCHIPPGSRVVSILINGSDHGSETALEADVGDGIVVDKYAAAQGLANGEYVKLGVEDPLLTNQPLGGNLTLTVTTGSDQASGQISGYVQYAIPHET